MGRKYIVLRRLPRARQFKAFNIAPVSKAKAQAEVRVSHRGAKSSFRIRKISDLKLSEVSNLTAKDIEKLWRRR